VHAGNKLATVCVDTVVFILTIADFDGGMRLAGLEGLYFYGEREGRGKEGKGKSGLEKGRGDEGRGRAGPPYANFWICFCYTSFDVVRK